MKRFIFILFLIQCSLGVVSQSDSIFHVVDIRVEGNKRTNEDAIIIRSQLKIDSWIGVPSAQTVHAMKALWATGDYKSVEILRHNVLRGIELVIKVEEYFSLGEIVYYGLGNSEIRRMNENEQVSKRFVYSPQTIKVIQKEIQKLLLDKGYVNHTISLDSVKTTDRGVDIGFTIVKEKRYRVDEVSYKNAGEVSKRKYNKSLENMRPAMKFWQGSLYEGNVGNEVKNLENKAKSEGYPYAEVDSFYIDIKNKKVDVTYNFNGSTRYTFGKFVWEGNTVFHDSVLNKVAEKHQGAYYSEDIINSVLYFSDNYRDISSMYYETGYAAMRLFHQLVPNENTGIIDVKISILEGPVMRFGKISFSGNIRTKEFVLLREILTTPGEPFSRSRIILSQQKLAQLEYFQNSKMDVRMIPDTISKTVAIKYIVEEKISDKLYISGGYGRRLVGTLGFDFKNFSAKDVFKKGTRWNPLPAGGGQHLSLKGQTDGVGYYGVSFNFYEPWLKGKPIGISFNGSYASIKDSIGNLDILNFRTTISHRPFKNDPFTYINYSLGYRLYNPDNFDVFGLTSGKFNSLTLKVGLLKNTTNGGVFPTSGNRFETSILTSLPPYSRYSETEALSLSTEDKFKWFEYYKFKLSYKNYQSFGNKNIVLASKFGVGYLGYFNKNIGTVPFERFFMGGTGLTNFDVRANEFIGLRGYETGDISSSIGDALAMKLSFELQKKLIQSDRFIFSTHLFAESGNTFSTLFDLDASTFNSAVGVGARVFAPIIGVFGMDIGWGINQPNFSWKTPTVQFTIGMDIGDF